MSNILPYLPEPPNPSNTMAAAPPGQEEGVFMPLQMLQRIAGYYSQYRPLIAMGARIARQKIPRELDQFMRDIATDVDAAQLQEYLTPGRPPAYAQGQGQWGQPPPGFEGEYEEDDVPPNLPGQYVMTRRMTERAYYLHEKKNMGVRQIAELFTSEGSPVSSATVARYIRDFEEYIETKGEGRGRKVALIIGIPALWIVSIFAANLLLKSIHVF